MDVSVMLYTSSEIVNIDTIISQSQKHLIALLLAYKGSHADIVNDFGKECANASIIDLTYLLRSPIVDELIRSINNATTSLSSIDKDTVKYEQELKNILLQTELQLTNCRQCTTNQYEILRFKSIAVSYLSGLINQGDQSYEVTQVLHHFTNNSLALTGDNYNSIVSPHRVQNINDAIALISIAGSYYLKDIIFLVKYIAFYGEDNSNKERVQATKTAMSVSSAYYPSVIYIWNEITDDIALLAEQIYHECLHCRFYRTLKSFQLFVDGYSGDAETSFECSWRKLPNGKYQHWSFHRTLGAFHVYVYLLDYYISLNKRIDNHKVMPYRDWISDRISDIQDKSKKIVVYLDTEYEKQLSDKGKTFYEVLVKYVQLQGG